MFNITLHLVGLYDVCYITYVNKSYLSKSVTFRTAIYYISSVVVVVVMTYYIIHRSFVFCLQGGVRQCLDGPEEPDTS